MKKFSRSIEETAHMLESSDIKEIVGGSMSKVDFSKNPPFWDFTSLAAYLELPVEVLAAINRVTCNHCYSKFYLSKDTHQIVPKDYPGKVREINAPCDDLKVVQKKLVEVFKRLPIHECNNGFIEGKNIITAVEGIQKGETLIHIDLTKFFDNHSSFYVANKIKEKFKTNFGTELDTDTLHALINILCMENKLPQGSPVSPLLVVVLNYEMDAAIKSLADEYHLSYVRYADDLAFSGTINNTDAHIFIRKLEHLVHPFRINFKKVGVMRHAAKPVLHSVTVKTVRFFSDTQEELITKLVGKAFNIPVEELQVLPFINEKNGHSNQLVFYSYKFEGLLKENVEAALTIIREGLPKITKFQTTVTRKFWYIQHKKSLLGMNIQEGEHNYPRAKYENLRVLAMLGGKQKFLQEVVDKVNTQIELVEKHSSRFDGIRNIKRNYRSIASLLSLYASKDNSNSGSFRNLIMDPINLVSLMGTINHVHNVDSIKATKLNEIFNKSYNKTKSELRQQANLLFPDHMAALFE